MKFLIIVFCALAAAGSAVPAAAGPFDLGFLPLVQGQGPGQGQSQGQGQIPRRGADRPMPQRDPRAADENDRSRMNPEERRQLRRDIQDAGKDIYRPDRQGRGEPRRSGRR